MMMLKSLVRNQMKQLIITTAILLVGCNPDETDAPQENFPPVFLNTPINNVLENTEYIFLPNVENNENDTLVFTITGKPYWAKFNTSTGELRGNAPQKSVFSNIVISVSDGQNTVSLPTFNIDVTSELHDVTIKWEAPTTNVNGDSIDNIIGYKIMYGESSQNYSKIVTINDPNVNEITIVDLENIDYYFSMKTVVLNGIKSEAAPEFKYEPSL